MGVVELKDGTLIFRQGDQKVTIKVEKKVAGEVGKKRLPKGAIQSLLPIFERAYDLYPNILSPEHSNWVKIGQDARHDPEKAINLLRRRGFSVEETSESLMEMAISLSGLAGEEKAKAKDTLRDWVEVTVHTLYLLTTEVTGNGK